MTVGIVFVSHSAKLAEGMVELARQMAASVTLVAAGGTDDGAIGTSFNKIEAAVREADTGDGVVIVTDLGSAELTADSFLDTLDEDARVARAEGAFVKDGIAAAVQAEQGADFDAVKAAADGNDASAPQSGAAQPTTAEAPAQASAASGEARRTAELVNEQGLHARPAAEFVKAAAGYDAKITVNGVDAKSLLGIMAMGAKRGTALELVATGSQAQEAVDGLAKLIATGFGE